MIFDGHIHIGEGEPDREGFSRNLEDAGIKGGVLISLPPSSFQQATHSMPASERLKNLLFWCGAGPNLYPFFCRL